MSETANYGLHLTDDSSETFMEWRTKMNGTDPESNMQKIDKALGEKADHSIAVSATLLSSAWIGIDAPFVQELSVEGLTKDQNGTINLAQDATPEQRDTARDAMLAIVRQSDGKLLIAADGKLPEEDLPVSIILLL